jgi:hypothetical protein
MRPAEAEVLRWAIMGGMLLRCVAALAGFGPREAGRMAAVKAYARVIGRAFSKWNGS